MKASELRIGNHILKNGVQSELTVELFLEYLRYTTPFDPIQLTEEWLLKFGFTLTSIGGYFNIENKDELLYIFINKDSCGIAIENKYADDDESEELSFNIKIQHVHQLQNLYFALTGEELTLQS